MPPPVPPRPVQASKAPETGPPAPPVTGPPAPTDYTAYPAPAQPAEFGILSLIDDLFNGTHPVDMARKHKRPIAEIIRLLSDPEVSRLRGQIESILTSQQIAATRTHRIRLYDLLYDLAKTERDPRSRASIVATMASVAQSDMSGADGITLKPGPPNEWGHNADGAPVARRADDMPPVVTEGVTVDSIANEILTALKAAGAGANG
jgi:hypothetical protein